jgi:Lon protease-like protein
MNDPAPLCAFNGRARLFPLPNLVFFPHVMQPLHIFEPRYREMTADALASDRFIALALPLPGWEKDYAAKPEIHQVACMGRIVADQKLEDGRYNILLRGFARIRIVKELASKKQYRVARAEPLNDIPLSDDDCEAHWRQTLIEKSPEWFPHQGDILEQFRKLIDSDLPLGTLCDIIAFALPLDAEFKQVLLEELDIAARLQLLHDFLEGARSVSDCVQRRFPPEFSTN